MTVIISAVLHFFRDKDYTAEFYRQLCQSPFYQNLQDLTFASLPDPFLCFASTSHPFFSPNTSANLPFSKICDSKLSLQNRTPACSPRPSSKVKSTLELATPQGRDEMLRSSGRNTHYLFGEQPSSLVSGLRPRGILKLPDCVSALLLVYRLPQPVPRKNIFKISLKKFENLQTLFVP